MQAAVHGRVLVVLLALLAGGCSSLAPRPSLPPDTAIAVATGSRLDDLIAPVEAAHPGQSGFRLMREGPESFAIRSRTALTAGRSLDIQTYIWHDDATGAFLAYRALEAADRGVKVRLLVDDMDARSKHYTFAALDAHPNVEVRMFNPFGSRTGALALPSRRWAVSAASIAACTTRPGSPITALPSSAAATWATNISARART